MIKRISPYLRLNRLIVVSKKGEIAYDELFHKGLNIIRGENSSGKSTITNFIYFAIGGDFKNWTDEALMCKEVFAEVTINGTIVTFNREISSKSIRPLSIFWGDYKTSSKSKSVGWKTFPYKQTENIESYTNIIFQMLDFPEARSDEDNKITLHQILRLIYIDQDSPIQNLFRFERFDVPLTRQAISELLLGVYDDSLYDDRLTVRKKSQLLDEKKRELKSIRTAFNLTGNEFEESSIDNSISEKSTKLELLNSEITELKNAEMRSRRKTTPLLIENLQKDLSKQKENLTDRIEYFGRLKNDIVDSELFIETLGRRIRAIDESILTRDNLGELELNFCPSCLNQIEFENIEPHSCPLCKKAIKGKEKSQILRLRNEIELQIKESKKLLEKRNRDVGSLEIELKSLIETTRQQQKEFDTALGNSSSTRDEKVDTLLISKGNIEKEIEHLINQKRSADLIKSLVEQCAILAGDVEKLNQTIDGKEFNQRKKIREANEEMDKITKEILRNDLERQDEFKDPEKVTIDFMNDVFQLDGKYNFSASSNTLFKNAVRFSIFFASLEKEFMRYPRFILCDNIEDKGMEEIRSKNFQKIIYNLSSESKVEHQIIMSTSMIDENLNKKDELLVGDFYKKTNKSMKI